MLWRSWVRIPALYTFFKKNRYRKLAYNSRDLVSSSYLATRDLEIWSQMYYLWRFRIGHSIRPSHEISKCQFIEMVSVIFGAEATDRRFGKNVLGVFIPSGLFQDGCKHPIRWRLEWWGQKRTQNYPSENSWKEWRYKTFFETSWSQLFLQMESKLSFGHFEKWQLK